MAIKISDLARTNPPDTNYPNGSIKDESIPGVSDDGTILQAIIENDRVGADAALLDEANITPSGNADTVNTSDRLDALKIVSNKAAQTPVTLASVVADTKLKINMARTISDRDNIIVDVILAGTTPNVDLPNGFNIVQCTGVPTLAVIVRESSIPVLKTVHYGSVTGTDITELLQQFALSPHKNKVISEGSYLSLSSDVIFLQGEDSVHFEGEVNFIADGTYAGSVIRFGSTTRTLIFTTIAQLDKDSLTIPTGGFLKDDLIAIWNPIDFSYSGFRDNYRQGEFTLASKDSVGGITALDQPVFDTYPIGTKIFKLTTDQTPKKISGIVNFTSTVYDLRICLIVAQGKFTDISDLQVKQEESSHTLQLLRCFKVSGDNVVAKQTASSVATGTDYGLVITNCQHIDVNGYFHAERHGCTTGGDGDDASIVNRWINVFGIISTTGQGNIAGAEWHGDTEYSSYGGKMEGLIVAGHKNKVTKGSYISGVPGVATPSVLGAEMKSMEHDLSDIEIYGALAQTSAKGVVDIGGISDAVTSNTTLKGRFSLRNSKITSPLNAVGVRFRNRGCVVEHDMDIRGLELDCPNATTFAVATAKVSGNDLRRLYMSGFFDPDLNPILIDTETNINGIEESRTSSITTATGISFVDLVVTFNKIFPEPPQVRLQYSGGYIDNKYPQLSPISITATGFTLRIQTYDASNFSTIVTNDVYWEASINK